MEEILLVFLVDEGGEGRESREQVVSYRESLLGRRGEWSREGDSVELGCAA